jgi:hypothetical protein
LRTCEKPRKAAQMRNMRGNAGGQRHRKR